MHNPIIGELKRYENFRSKYIEPRNVDVWMPPSYREEKKFSVIYMHDGQNLFDSTISFIGVDWGIDETISSLINENKIKNTIVVGIWNTSKRVPEYMPEKPFNTQKGEKALSKFVKHVGSLPISDNYLKFIVEELKPFIDSNYNTLTDKENTYMIGSSMGGLISIYGVCEYPEIFGGCACLSTHWIPADGIVIDYIEDKLPPSGSHKIYFDHGTLSGDELYAPYQKRVDKIMRLKNYQYGKNWITKVFIGDEHSERAWRKRVYIPLTFLLGK